jgi:hypothetical protein
MGILPGQSKNSGQQNAALHIFDRPSIAQWQARSGIHAFLLMQRKRKLAKKCQARKCKLRVCASKMKPKQQLAAGRQVSKEWREAKPFGAATCARPNQRCGRQAGGRSKHQCLAAILSISANSTPEIMKVQ